ncbi:DUF2511 domain-containing protein [Kitasatospora sp. NPDC052868]|uniref:DUF2511 domain-containing protein n=1 Tax=Kitasatospora sp. NPDC052868 TaxID=3364060 RepID=UPI0037C92620
MSETAADKPTGPDPELVRRYKALLGVGVVAVVVFAVVRGCASDDSDKVRSRAVTSGEVVPWPFTVSAGMLRCRPGEKVTFEVGGVEYALNGLAQADFPKPTAIWADDPVLGHGLKKDIGKVIAAGRALC